MAGGASQRIVDRHTGETLGYYDWYGRRRDFLIRDKYGNPELEVSIDSYTQDHECPIITRTASAGFDLDRSASVPASSGSVGELMFSRMP